MKEVWLKYLDELKADAEKRRSPLGLDVPLEVPSMAVRGWMLSLNLVETENGWLWMLSANGKGTAKDLKTCVRHLGGDYAGPSSGRARTTDWTWRHTT